MENNFDEKYLASLKQIERLSVDAILVIKDLYRDLHRERKVLEDVGVDSCSGDWEKWTKENEKIITRLKITVEELNKFTNTL